MQKAKLKEIDLYQPVHNFLTAQGYLVRGEVNDCDIAASKDDQLVVVELKRQFNLELVIQGVTRQKIADMVYLAIPRPKSTRRRWNDIYHLLRRLELGLLFVSFTAKKPQVEIALQPVPFDRQRSRSRAKKKRLLVMEEIANRTGDYNVGGSTRTKLMTVYREQAIQIAVILREIGPTTAKDLRKLGTSAKTYTILRKNHYGWFEHPDYGIYALSELGAESLTEYPELVAHYLSEYRAPIVK